MLIAKDLSVHLFNGYSLNRRAEKSTKDRINWTPSGEWTAWPMLACDVPRLESDGAGSGAGADDGLGLKSREHLRGLLLAHITKVARERFTARECDGCDGVNSCATPIQTQAVPVARSSAEAGDLRSDHEEPPKRSTSEISGSSSVRSKKRKRDDGSENVDMEPVPITDDDRALRIAGPGVEHVISSFEQLLGGLGVARRAYFSQGRQTSRCRRSSKKASRTSSRAAASTSRSRSKASKRHSSNSHKMSLREDSQESDTGSIDASENEADTQSAKAASRLRTLQRYGLRDWKDVLGMAAILGWNEQVLRRTRDRCAVLFDESVPMDDLDLNPAGKDAEFLASEDEMEGGVHVDGYLRPIKRRPGWRGKNKQQGNWKSRAKAKRMVQTEQTSDLVDIPLDSIEHHEDPTNILPTFEDHYSSPSTRLTTASTYDEEEEEEEDEEEAAAAAEVEPLNRRMVDSSPETQSSTSS